MSRNRATIATTLSALLIAGAAPASASPPTDPPEPSAWGQLAGIVTGPDAAAAGDICVDAFDPVDGWSGWGMTDESGIFLFEVPVGSYVVGFSDCADIRRFPMEYYEDALTPEDATLVAVREGATTEIAATLDAGATISGALVDDVGSVASSVCVDANPTSDDGTGSWATSADDGTYTVRGLRGGDYVLSFASCDLPHPIPVPMPVPTATPDRPAYADDETAWPYGYLTEFWDDATTLDAATPVTVPEAATVDGIDAVLQRASGIDVALVDPAGEPADAMCVSAHAPDGEWLASAYGDGWLTVSRLEAGQVALFVEDCGYGVYEEQWYDGAARIGDATLIEVPEVAGVSVTVALTLAPLPDLTVAALSVTPVPLRTDAADLPGPGTQRDLHLEVANEGDGDADVVGIIVEATTRTDGGRDILYTDVRSMPAGASTEVDLRIDMAGKVGDVQVRATTCTWAERDTGDNSRTVQSYAIVGGTGVGVDARSVLPAPFTGPGNWWIDCESLLWGGEPVPL
jgi:hypothetical protein